MAQAVEYPPSKYKPWVQTPELPPKKDLRFMFLYYFMPFSQDGWNFPVSEARAVSGVGEEAPLFQEAMVYSSCQNLVLCADLCLN
jgi:hypothetical protein